MLLYMTQMVIQLLAKVHVWHLINHNIVALRALVHPTLANLVTIQRSSKPIVHKLIVMHLMIKAALSHAMMETIMRLHFVLYMLNLLLGQLLF